LFFVIIFGGFMGEGVGSAVRKGEAEGSGVRVLVLLAAASVIIMKVAVVYGVTFLKLWHIL
jgi:hypothetical protein